MLEAREAWSSPEQAPQELDQLQEEQSAEPSADDDKLMDLGEPAAHDIVSPKDQAEEHGRTMSDAGYGACDMQHHLPGKVAIAGARSDGRAGGDAHNAHNQVFADKPLGIDGRTMGSLPQLEADQRLIRERILRLEKQLAAAAAPNGSTASEARRQAPPA